MSLYAPLIPEGWAIPRKDIIIKTKLGKGEFGGEFKKSVINIIITLIHSEVWLGEFRNSKVAIKMLKEIESAQDTQKFLAEASVMTLVVYHDKIVYDIVFCLQDIKSS